MKKSFLLILSLILFTDCNVALFVSKDNVIKIEQGYIIILPYNKFVEFIPSKIDTTLSLVDNISKHKLGSAFYLYNIELDVLNYLKIFGDTLSNGQIIVPVKFEYRQMKERNRQLREQGKVYHEHFFTVNEKIYHYKINTQNVLFISAFPLLSEEKKRQKTMDFELNNAE